MNDIECGLFALLWITTMTGIAFFIQGKSEDRVIQYKKGFALILLSWLCGITILSIVTDIGPFLIIACLVMVSAFSMAVFKKEILNKVQALKQVVARLNARSIKFR